MTQINPTLSVIIPAFNAALTIYSCLAAIYHSDTRDFEVIVIDDHSTDHTLEIVRLFPCQTVSLEQNFGSSKAKNIGRKTAQGSILVFIDSDIQIFKFLPIL